MLANMTKRGSLAVNGPAGALTYRGSIYNPGTYNNGVVVGYPRMTNVIGYSRGVPAYFNSRINEIPTINCIGNTVYVDHSKSVSGNGLSWETAYASLNDMLHDPLIYYTTVSQRQVVHVLVRGVVDYMVYNQLSDAYSQFYNYLVIHNCTFYYETSEDIPLIYDRSNMIAACICLGGVVFHTCTFTVVQHNGVNGTGSGGDGEAPKHKTIYKRGSDTVEGDVNRLALFSGDYNYLYKCHLAITAGDGGNGASGADNVSGGIGGDAGTIVLGVEAYDSCTFDLHYGNPGNGGDGIDGGNSNGGSAGASGRIEFSPEKMYGCTINITYAPSCRGGDGGDGLASSSYTDGGVGSGGNATGSTGYGIGLSLDFGNYVNACTFNINLDLSNAIAGEGGKYTSSDEYGTRNHDAEGGAISSHLGFNALWVKNSSINLNVIHNGTGNRVELAILTINIRQSYNNNITMHNTCTYSPYKNGFNNFELVTPVFDLQIRNASDTTVQVTQGNIAQLPDGENLETLISQGEVYGYNWSVGGSTNSNNQWFVMDTVRGYATDISQEHQFGLRVRLQKPGTITCGYPSGGGGGSGYRVIGKNGIDNENVYARRGGDGSAAFTWMNWTEAAGTAGEGIRGASSGGLLNFTGTDYNSDIVDIAFIND